LIEGGWTGKVSAGFGNRVLPNPITPAALTLAGRLERPANMLMAAMMTLRMTWPSPIETMATDGGSKLRRF